MPYTDREPAMAQEKNVSFTVRCDADFRDWLGREVVAAGTDVSKLVRAALILAVPQIKALRGLDRVALEDIREPDSRQ